MNIMIEKMNRILANWKSQFDILSVLDLRFTAKDSNLYFNDLPLCMEQDLDLEFARFTAKKIIFRFQGNKSIQILISWPEDEIPIISSVSFVYQMGASVV